MFLAVGGFGASPVTIAGVITGELILIAFLTHRYPYEEDDSSH